MAHSKFNHGAAVRKLRLAVRVSQVELARRIKVNQAQLSRMEGGERQVTWEKAREIRSAIDAILKKRQAAIARLTGGSRR
jgi:transcriptional regulator with XRE-family HTH domain